jgi:hypothetical protein
MSDDRDPVNLAAELVAAAHRQTHFPIVALRAFGVALHEIAADADMDLDAALAIVIGEARAIELLGEEGSF